MKNTIRFIVLLLLFSTCAFTQYKIPQSVIGNGGTVVTNNNHRITGTVGQNLIGITSSNSFSSSAGFWYIPGRILTSIEQSASTLPLEYRLKQNYPNPFNPSTTIKFDIPQASYVTLKIYNMLGQELTELINEEKKPGAYNVTWNAFGFSSGIYFYRMTAGNFSDIKKMLLVR
ncbi:MAG: T9SS type A sorting domain-containing protein [Ignavibacteriales bacterium]|nr:T9SS type A sorting domain-containing protein [Ignavibacteriales bacterium]